MKDQEETILDQGNRLSKSRLWQLQHAIYSYYGPKAWTEAGVPFYMTSNPYTARQYAKMALGYIRDCIRGVNGKVFDRSHPLYVFDLGAGTGRFGYLFLRELSKFLSQPQFDGIRLCYVMTDMIDSNLQYLRYHPYLQEMIDQKALDFAVYHTSFVEDPLKLQVSGKELIPGNVVNSPILIGNYFFDVIPQDLFKVVNKRLHEGLVTVVAKGIVDVAEPNPALLKELYAKYEYVPLKENETYYPDQFQEAVLQDYAGTLESIPFTLPVAAFQTLSYFKRMSGGHMFLLAGDQGVSNEQQLRNAQEPVVSVQGGISMSVSYHAIAKYVVKQGGAAWLTTHPDPLFVTIAAAFGGGKEFHSETTMAFEDTFEYFQPSDYWRLTCCSEQEWTHPSIEYLLLLVKLGNWDPLNFHAFFTAIRHQLPEASQNTQSALVETIKLVWDHFYPVTKEEGDFLMNLGVLLFELKQPADALIFFERALIVNGGNAQIHQNIAACRRFLQRPVYTHS